MEFEGRIIRVLPVRSGTSQRGEWKQLPFVFEYFESGEQRWSDKVLLETFDTNIMAQIGKYLKKGPDGKAVVENGECVLLCELKCRCGFSHSVRTFDKQDGTKATINDVRLYKFEIVAAQQTQQQQPAFGQQAAPFPPQVDAQGNPITNQGGNYDDLPF
jgi:hypothetical protein